MKKNFITKVSIVVVLLSFTFKCFSAWTGNAPKQIDAHTDDASDCRAGSSVCKKVYKSGECKCKLCPGNQTESFSGCNCVDNPNGTIYVETTVGTCSSITMPCPTVPCTTYYCSFPSDPTSSGDETGPNCDRDTN